MDTVRDTEKDAYDVAVDLIEVVNAKAATEPDGQLWAISSLSIIIRNLAMVEPWLKDRLEAELAAFKKLT